MSAYHAIHKGRVTLGVDVTDAFTSIDRSAVATAVAKHAMEVSPVAEVWLRREIVHTIANGRNEGSSAKQIRGLDQGCPLSPAFYAIGIKDALDNTEKAMKEVDRESYILALLDDTYMMGTPEAALVGYTTYKRELGRIGLVLNEPKTKLLIPGDSVPKAAIPEELAKYVTDKLKAVGATVLYAKTDGEDWRDVEVSLDCEENITRTSSNYKEDTWTACANSCKQGCPRREPQNWFARGPRERVFTSSGHSLPQRSGARRLTQASPTSSAR